MICCHATSRCFAQLSARFLSCAQRDNLFYPTWAFALPNIVLLQMPQGIVESFIWSIIT